MESNNYSRTLIDKYEIKLILYHLAKDINTFFLTEKETNKVVLLGVLTGAFMLISDLCKRLKLECEIDFFKLRRYSGNKGSSFELVYNYCIDINNKHIIIVDDVLDKLITIDEAIKIIRKDKPASISVCGLLAKPNSHQRKLPEDTKVFVGKKIGDVFVAGYGMDDEIPDGRQINRNLDFIYIVKT